MSREGMRAIFKSSPSPTRMTPPPSPLHITFSESSMEENIQLAELTITKWDSLPNNNDSCNMASLFSDNNREEAKHYFSSIRGLQKAMQYLVSNRASSEKLVRAQTLMQIAMKRLQNEFYRILKSNRFFLDSESSATHSSSTPSDSAHRLSFSDFEESEFEKELRNEIESLPEAQRVSLAAMEDLSAISEVMIKAGYAKECIRVYRLIRKSFVDEALYSLGVDRTLNLQKIQKMDWEVLEIKIKNWLHAVKTAVKTLFSRERILSDQVFSIAPTMRDYCFAEITKEGALTLFEFPENVAKCKKTPEKMFRFLDLYEAVTNHWPDIESMFSSELTSAVRSNAIKSLIKLGDAVRTMLTSFETAIQNDTSKTTVPGGGIHPLTRYVMNYLSFLADYSEILSDIVADWPLTIPSPLPEPFFGSPDSEDCISSPVSVRLAWLILLMLCKLQKSRDVQGRVAFLFVPGKQSPLRCRKSPTIESKDSSR